MKEISHLRPLVVLSNDDGVDAPGLQVLVVAMQDRCDVLVAAPMEERSASSHCVNMVAEWVIHRLSPDRYGVEGSPADCVYLALCQLAPRPASLVISGINRGFNLGTDVFYSGTVAAAAEGVILGVPGIAVSAEASASARVLERAARFTAALAMWVLSHRWAPRATLLNVNVPARGTDAFSLGALGARAYPRAARIPGSIASGSLVRLERPRLVGTEGSEGQDADIVRAGRIALTPLRLDWTHPEELEYLSENMRLDGFDATSL